MVINPIVFIIIMVVLIIVGSFTKDDFSDDVRKKQAKNQLNESAGLVDSVKAYTDKKIKFSKRAAIDKLCKQAGTPFTYAHYFIARIACALALGFVSLLTKNVFLAAIMCFVGFMVPGEILKSMRNKRVEKLEKQIGPFLQMVITRYNSSKDFEKALKLTREEFKGMEPIYTELKLTTAEIESKIPAGDALDNMAIRCENKYLARFADYYRIASVIGTKDARENLLGQAYEQFEEERKLRAMLKREIQEPKRDAMICIASIPLFMCFGIFAMDGYWEYITQEFLGQILVAGVAATIIGLVWFINTKIGAPLT